jgi:hypothetical protein
MVLSSLTKEDKMQDHQNNLTYQQANNLFWLSLSPLGLLGLARYQYEGNIGFMREAFILYFAFGVLGYFGLLHFFQQVSPDNSNLLATAISWGLWGSVVFHVVMYIGEAQFFYDLRNKLNTSN